MDWFTSPSGAFVSFLVALVSLAFAIVFYYKSKRDKEPCWSAWTVALFKGFSSTVEGLEAQYRGEKVQNLSISNVIFWNDGRLTIDRSDITDADPLRLEVQGHARILSVTLLAVNSPASRPTLTHSDGNRVLVSFDYLDRGQGFVIRVIHEGTSSGDLQVKGVLRGVTKIKGYDWSTIGQPTKNDYLITGGCLFSLLLLTVVGTRSWDYVMEFVDVMKDHYNTFTLLIFYACSGAILLGFSLLLPALIWSTFFRFFWIPQGLESFRNGPIQSDFRAKT